MDGIGSCRNSHFKVGIDHTDSEVTLLRINGGVCEVKTRVDFGLTLIICVGVWVVRVFGMEVDTLSHIAKVFGRTRCCGGRCPAVCDC